MTQIELIIQLLKVAIGLAFGAYFVWWSLEVLDRLAPEDEAPTPAVGRMVKVHAAPVGTPWMWTLAFGHHEDRTPTHGYAATRETATYQCHLFDSVHTGSLSSVIIFGRGDIARVRSRGVHWRGGRSF
jgi:hypothetical protein